MVLRTISFAFGELLLTRWTRSRALRATSHPNSSGLNIQTNVAARTT
jgi:hypothetical protein